MKEIYCLGCYTKDAYIFHVPLRASAAWLRKLLRRKNLLSGSPLRKSQVLALRPKLTDYVEIGYYGKLEYYIERINL